MSVALTGQDTIILGGRYFRDFGDGDVATLAFENDLFEVVNGKNDNAVFALNNKGKQGTLTLKLIRGSSDDIFLNSQLTLATSFFPSYRLMTGSFVKLIGDGNGRIFPDGYRAQGGIPSRVPDANSSSDGKTDDGHVTWVIKFAKMIRVL